jgi:galactofuranose transport system permease protein
MSSSGHHAERVREAGSAALPFNGWLRRAWPQLAALLLVLSLNGLVAPGFFDISLHDGRLFGSLVDILNRGAPVALLTLGMTLVIATRGIDLSVGAVMAIAGAVAATVVNAGPAGWLASLGFAPWLAALLLALAIGVVCGLWNGLLVAVLGIQPIVATLILMVAGRGIAQLIAEGRIVTFVDPGLIQLGSGSVLGLPMPFILVLCAAAITAALVRLTALGLFIESVGVNERSSRLAGVSTRGTLLFVYMWCGFMAALAGVIASADIRGADANNAGLWLELDAILAVVIGGTSLLGGRFALSLALLGAFTIQALKTGILHAGLPPELNLIVMAAAVAVVLCLQSPRWQRA